MMSRTCSVALAAALTVLGGGCKSAPPVDPVAAQARAVAVADVRLRGAWVLQGFTPDTALEPMLVPMLQFQFGQMVVKLDGQHAVADSPGLHLERMYRITNVQGDQFELVTFDEQGVSYQVNALFLGDNDLRFRSTTMPWKGVGTLRRSAAAATTTTTTTTTTTYGPAAPL